MSATEPEHANARCIATLRGLMETARRRGARELTEDLERALLIVEEATRRAQWSVKP